MITLPKSKLTNRGKTIMLSLTAVFTSLVIAGAFIQIPIPVIPFTLQTFFVQLTSSMMGPLWGAIVIGLYLFMGLVGIPVFSKGGGFMYVLQPTFGYLIGFFIGTIVGALVIKCFKKKTYWAYLAGNIVNLLIAYSCGMIYFYFLQTFYFGKTVSAYTIFVSLFLIFLPGDLTFTFVASFVATKLKPILNKLVYQTATNEDIEKFEKDNAGKENLFVENSDKMYQNNSESSKIACDVIDNTDTQLNQTTAKENNNTYDIIENTNIDELIIKDKTKD